MSRPRLDVALPALLGFLCLGVLVLWQARGAGREIVLRVPGMDGSKEAPIEAIAREIVGELIPGEGRPADLPGSWSRFRGDAGDGRSSESTPLARQWPKGGPPTFWSIPVGEGYAGAAVRRGRVYLVDYDHENEGDAIRCLSLQDGREIWRYAYPVKVKRNHGMSRTVPAVTDRYVVAMGPKCHVTCLDATSGQKLWQIDLVARYGTKVPQWYTGQCPLVMGDRVVLAPAGKKALLVALELSSGTPVWTAPNPDGWKMTHSSICPLEIDGQALLLYCAKKGVVGIDPADGRRLLKSREWKIGIATVPTPVPIGDGRVFFSGGYNAGSLMARIEREGNGFSLKPLFRLEQSVFGAIQQTPILHEEHLYGVRADGQLVCLTLEGSVAWESGTEKTFGLGPFLLANGLLFVLDEDARLSLVEASPKAYRELASATLLEEGHEAWAPLALAGGRLLARDFDRLVCVDVSRP